MELRPRRSTLKIEEEYLLQALSDSCKQLPLVWVDGGYHGRLLERFKSCSKSACAPVPRKDSRCSPDAGS